MTGRTITLTVALDASIKAIKEMIWRTERTPISQQRLRYGGKQLEDGKGLGDYHILGESTLHLIARLCGGGPEPDGCADSSGKSLGDDKDAVQQDAVNNLRITRQRRQGSDVRHRLGKELAERDIALLKLKRAQTALKLTLAEHAEKDADLARREEEVRVHLDETRRMHERMECMLRQESAEHVKDLRKKLKEELAVLQAVEKHWRTEWYQQYSELATERLKSARLEAELVEQNSKFVHLGSELATEKLKVACLEAELEETVLEKQKIVVLEKQRLAVLVTDIEKQLVHMNSAAAYLNSELRTEELKSARLDSSLAAEKQNSALIKQKSALIALEAEQNKQKAEKKLGRAESEHEECEFELEDCERELAQTELKRAQYQSALLQCQDVLQSIVTLSGQ
jgi:hypothetical protein